MQKKIVVGVLGAVMAMIVAAISLVMVVAPRVNAADDGIPVLGQEYLDIRNNYYCLGLNTAGKNYVNTLSKYRIKVPDECKTAGSYSGLTGLVSIDLPSGLQSIDSFTFSGCTGLTSIEIPDTVTTIGPGAFQSCSSLISVNIPRGVKKIDDTTFF